MLYSFLIFKTLTWLFYYGLLFGTNAIAYSSQAIIPLFQKPAFLLNLFTSPHLPLVFILFVLISSACLLIFQKLSFRFSFVLNFMIWLLVVNLHHKIYPSLTGGNFLLNQFLLFNCFLSFAFATPNGTKGELKKVIHNFAVLAVITQLCLAYFLSAVAKFGDEAWLSGSAIEGTLQVQHYFLFSGAFILPVPVSRGLNFLILFYQLFFPFLWFFQKLKKPFLMLGIVTHLYIAFVMGLVDFGIIMILGYVYFWPVKQANS